MAKMGKNGSLAKTQQHIKNLKEEIIVKDTGVPLANSEKDINLDV